MRLMTTKINKSSLAAVKSPNYLALRSNSHSHRDEPEGERGARGLTVLVSR